MADIRGDYAWFYTDNEGELFVVRRCPECQRFVKTGEVLINGLGERVRLLKVVPVGKVQGQEVLPIFEPELPGLE